MCDSIIGQNQYSNCSEHKCRCSCRKTSESNKVASPLLINYCNVLLDWKINYRLYTCSIIFILILKGSHFFQGQLRSSPRLFLSYSLTEIDTRSSNVFVNDVQAARKNPKSRMYKCSMIFLSGTNFNLALATISFQKSSHLGLYRTVTANARCRGYLKHRATPRTAFAEPSPSANTAVSIFTTFRYIRCRSCTTHFFYILLNGRKAISSSIVWKSVPREVYARGGMNSPHVLVRSISSLKEFTLSTQSMRVTQIRKRTVRMLRRDGSQYTGTGSNSNICWNSQKVRYRNCKRHRRRKK